MGVQRNVRHEHTSVPAGAKAQHSMDSTTYVMYDMPLMKND